MFPLHDNNPTVRFPALTLLLCALNVGIYFWQSTLTEPQLLELTARHAFTADRLTNLWQGKDGTVALGENVTVEFPPDKVQVYSTMLTSMFMHGGWAHVLGNMWYLWLFGNNIEDRLGRVRFLILYFLGGLAAIASQWGIDPRSMIPCLGASGAVASVMGAYIITYPHARVRTLVFLMVLITLIDLPAIVVIGFWFLIQLVEGLNAMQLGINGGVAWFAHVGGFLAGMVLMLLLKIGVPPPVAPEGRRMFESFQEPRRFRGSGNPQW